MADLITIWEVAMERDVNPQLLEELGRLAVASPALEPSPALVSLIDQLKAELAEDEEPYQFAAPKLVNGLLNNCKLKD